MIAANRPKRPSVTKAEMREVYEKIKTPVKLGPVMKWEKEFTDSATVFKKDGVFYMCFISISKDVSISGYETHMARSADLKYWEYMGKVLRRNDYNHWDSKQCAGYTAFPDIRYEGEGQLEMVNGMYYLSYLAGNSDGYEPDPLYMGLVKSSDPTDGEQYIRLENPILRPEDPDARPGEEKTLYKSFLFRDPLNSTGYPYVNVYNAKDHLDRERIYLAVSRDGETWERYGDRPVLDLVTDDPDGIITGDPQIVLIDDIYVMLFFHYRRGYPAQDTFACSRDLVNWTPWDGEPLVTAEYPFENIHAHKPWFIRHNGKNYHFYCAVNDQNERFIALATSE